MKTTIEYCKMVKAICLIFIGILIFLYIAMLRDIFAKDGNFVSFLALTLIFFSPIKGLQASFLLKIILDKEHKTMLFRTTFQNKKFIAQQIQSLGIKEIKWGTGRSSFFVELKLIGRERFIYPLPIRSITSPISDTEAIRNYADLFESVIGKKSKQSSKSKTTLTDYLRYDLFFLWM